MIHTSKAYDRTESGLLIARNLIEPVKAGGFYEYELVRNGRIIDTWSHYNICTAEGLTHSLALSFAGETQHNWYVALANTDSHTPVDGDTYQTVMSSGNYEFVAYKETTREAWTPGTPSSKSVDNSASKAEFTIDTGGPYSVYGAMLVSLSTKNDATAGNYLYSFGLFSAAKTGLIEDDIVRVTITLSLTNT